MPRPKEFLYVGHYRDTKGRYMLKVGTTNDLDRRKREHERHYKTAKAYTMPQDGQFIYDGAIKLSKYNTLRFEDKTREQWQADGIGDYVRNDRFNCGKRKPDKVTITIRKTYEIDLGD